MVIRPPQTRRAISKDDTIETRSALGLVGDGAPCDCTVPAIPVTRATHVCRVGFSRIHLPLILGVSVNDVVMDSHPALQFA